MRALVIQEIKAIPFDDTFAGVQNRVWARGALGNGGVPADPPRPYILVAFGEAPAYAAVRETSTSVSHNVRIYVYDDTGSFARINEIHRLVRQTLEGLGGMVSPSGRRCTDAAFLTLGQEDTVTELKAGVRVATYRITGPQ